MSQPDFKLQALRMGAICLRSKNLDSLLSFYREDMGLKTIRTEGDYTTLGTESGTHPLLILHHDERASTPPANGTGLYHYALLVPDRSALAAAYLGLGRKGVVFDGYADHQVSEALYLTDPEGNGIEIYRDRPRDEWKFDEGQVEMTTQPLDLDSLIQDSGSRGQQKAIADKALIGHVHLKVSDLQSSLVFYRDGLGFELMRYLGSAAFLSAGGYHHHIGMNTWESLNGPPSRKTFVGLEYFEVVISESDLSELSSRLNGSPIAQMLDPKQLFVSDPDEISLLFKTA